MTEPAPGSFDPARETPAVDEDEQSPDDVAMALAAPEDDDTADAGPTLTPEGEAT